VVGDLEQYKAAISLYENYDFSKTNEFLYHLNGKVIKFFADVSIAQKRVRKASLNKAAFPRIDYQAGQFYGYNYVEGETLYKHNNSAIFSGFLTWLDRRLWRSSAMSESDTKAMCRKFYHDKTMERLTQFGHKYRNSDGESVVNGVAVPSTAGILERVPWDLLSEGVPSFIHGDLQFDNILYNSAERTFTLLDWRQDFAGHVETGDLYYDLAKLYGGIILNYDYIKANLFSYSEKHGEISFDFAQRYSRENFIRILENFITEKGWNLQKVRLLVPIIYLNMSPLHHYPFDKMLYSLGRLMLFEELEKQEKIPLTLQDYV
jgi:hypothetical protein